MTGYPLIAIADYSGGKCGKCCYNWYFSRSTISAACGIGTRLQPVVMIVSHRIAYSKVPAVGNDL
jgi:hypothetical protein